MSLVTQLRSERAKLNEQIQALARIEGEGGALNAEQLKQFEQLGVDFNVLTDKLSRAEVAERIATESAVPVDESAQGIASPPNGSRISGPFTDKPIPGANMARMARVLAASRGDQHAAAKLAHDSGYDPAIAMALSTVTPGAGGVLVPQSFSSEVIELLRPKSVVRKLGAVSLPLLNGNLTVPRIKGGAVVGYIGTDEDMPVTDVQFDDLKLSAKKLAALVPISNDLLSYSGTNPNVDRLVVNDLTASVALAEDLSFIRGAGTGNLPKGLRFWAPDFNVIICPPDKELHIVEMALSSIILRLEEANSGIQMPGFIMAPRTKRWLAALRDGNGNKAYPELDLNLLKGFPVATTTQVPINLGNDGDASEIYFADFADCFIGEDDAMVIDFSKEATYKDANGNVVSAFQRDQTLVRVIAKHDFGPRHVESIAVLTDVVWGKGL
ncbi:HK97 family phage major capsid protein [Pseudomonas sp. JUb42]|uniref:phage major capsid protein n=1 Tax=Pseudomonas sp. JUb42 TaxID=2940611 RepID=UPI002167A992|nr:phage major capsid protein [Pseudomonas sp. JUb42]MCS3467402.1 HK97 family phage major capsid protein [Pseudomonas sp. JUb42]